jgi:addiction module HigA family antidote
MDKKLERLKRRTVRPTHPGEFLREDVLPELGITQGELAKRLGVSRLTVSDILLEKRPISPDMAWRLGKLLGNGAGLWLNMQHTVDTWDALHIDAAKYDSIEPIRQVA